MRAAMRSVRVFYDFACPYCFVAHERVRRLWNELPLRFEWVPWEIYPETPVPGVPRAPEWQVLGPGLEALFAEQNLPFRPSELLPNTNLALRAALWCEARGLGEDFRDGVYRRLYERGLDNHLYDPEVLAALVERVGLDPIGFLEDMRAGAFAKELRDHDALAEELGVRWVPTFVVGKSSIVGDVPWQVLDAALRASAGRGAPASAGEG